MPMVYAQWVVNKDTSADSRKSLLDWLESSVAEFESDNGLGLLCAHLGDLAENLENYHKAI